jgi:hypothetical protein
MNNSEFAWTYRDDANCKGTVETLGPVFWSTDPADIATALALCKGCSVREECAADRGPVFLDILFIRGGVRM